MKTWDAIVVGGGVIGLSLARELRKYELSVLIVERGEPGREASHAAAGMLAPSYGHAPEALRSLAMASAALYPEFVREVEDESGMRVDLRRDGSLVFVATGEPTPSVAPLTLQELSRLEPRVGQGCGTPYLIQEEGSVDPRALVAALMHAAKHRNVDLASGAAVEEIIVQGGRATGVRTARTKYQGALVIDCAGAWSGGILPHFFPVRPVKGQMLAVVAADHHPIRGPLVHHVLRAPGVYIVPRSDGRMLIGSTLEDVGFDKQVDPDTIQQLHQAAANLVPDIGQCRMLEAWAGLRPGTPDCLPLVGATPTSGYFVATGHYTDGILLAPITARCMADVVRGIRPAIDLAPFAPSRFAI